MCLGSFLSDYIRTILLIIKACSWKKTVSPPTQSKSFRFFNLRRFNEHVRRGISWKSLVSLSITPLTVETPKAARPSERSVKPWAVHARRRPVFFLSPSIYNAADQETRFARVAAARWIYHRSVASPISVGPGRDRSRRASNIPITESGAIKSLDRIIRAPGFVSIKSYTRVRIPRVGFEPLPRCFASLSPDARFQLILDRPRG